MSQPPVCGDCDKGISAETYNRLGGLCPECTEERAKKKAVDMLRYVGGWLREMERTHSFTTGDLPKCCDDCAAELEGLSHD